MQGFVYFDIHDRARLPGRFYGESLSVTARLGRQRAHACARPWDTPRQAGDPIHDPTSYSFGKRKP